MAEVEEKQAKPKHDETPLEAFASICGVLAVGLFVLVFVFQNFAIPSSSMVKALLVGDHVLVDRITLAPPAAYAPFVYYRNVRHGDIIVFYKPTLEAEWGSSVSGEAGDGAAGGSYSSAGRALCIATGWRSTNRMRPSRASLTTTPIATISRRFLRRPAAM